MARAVVLLSGGLDSAVTAYLAKAEGHAVYALTFAYGQRHGREVEAAKAVADALGVAEHKIVAVDLAQIGGSALTDASLPVPEGRRAEEIGRGIPATYVPARNTIFLAFGLAYAEVVDADFLDIGANALDYAGYPDCRPEFYEAFQEVARLGTKRGVEGRPIRVRHPLVRLTKAAIVRKGAELGVPFERTWSCYHGRDEACGVCDSCQLRRKGFREAGMVDPLPYETGDQTSYL